jgi:hypothetical protein
LRVDCTISLRVRTSDLNSGSIIFSVFFQRVPAAVPFGFDGWMDGYLVVEAKGIRE